MYPQLLQHIQSYVQLTPGEEQLLCNRLQPLTLPRKACLLEQGQHCKGDYFVISGCLRQFFVNSKLNEQVINFGLENWWITDHDSLLNHQPAKSSIQALEPCSLLLLPKKDKETLFIDVPKLQHYFLIMTQKALVASQRRIGFIFNQTEEERYRHFAKLYPAFLQRVPQYMLASYLGFTPQFMSRIRAKNLDIS